MTGKEIEMGELIYGFYHGGDPREFRPDAEMCSQKELDDHQAACRTWDEAEARGETPTPEACESGWKVLPDGTIYHAIKSRYGIGTYRHGDEDGDGGMTKVEPLRAGRET